MLEWIFERTDNDNSISQISPIGIIPKLSSLNIESLNMNNEQLVELFKIDKKFWAEELAEIQKYFDEYVNDSMPPEIYQQLENLQERINNMADWEFV